MQYNLCSCQISTMLLQPTFISCMLVSTSAAINQLVNRLLVLQPLCKRCLRKCCLGADKIVYRKEYKLFNQKLTLTKQFLVYFLYSLRLLAIAFVFFFHKKGWATFWNSNIIRINLRLDSVSPKSKQKHALINQHFSKAILNNINILYLQSI